MATVRSGVLANQARLQCQRTRRLGDAGTVAESDDSICSSAVSGARRVGVSGCTATTAPSRAAEERAWASRSLRSQVNSAGLTPQRLHCTKQAEAEGSSAAGAGFCDAPLQTALALQPRGMLSIKRLHSSISVLTHPLTPSTTPPLICIMLAEFSEIAARRRTRTSFIRQHAWSSEDIGSARINYNSLNSDSHLFYCCRVSPIVLQRCRGIARLVVAALCVCPCFLCRPLRSFPVFFVRFVRSSLCVDSQRPGTREAAAVHARSEESAQCRRLPPPSAAPPCLLPLPSRSSRAGANSSASRT